MRLIIRPDEASSADYTARYIMGEKTEKKDPFEMNSFLMHDF